VDRDTSHTIAKCHFSHHGEEDYEREWRQDASLVCAVGNSKSAVISPFSTIAARMPSWKKTNDVDKTRRAANLQQNFPEEREWTAQMIGRIVGVLLAYKTVKCKTTVESTCINL